MRSSRSVRSLSMLSLVVLAACHGAADPPKPPPPPPAPPSLDLVIVVEGHGLFIGPPGDPDVPTAYPQVRDALDKVGKALPPDAHVTVIVPEEHELLVRAADLPARKLTGDALGAPSKGTVSPHWANLLSELRALPAAAGRRRAILTLATGCDYDARKDVERRDAELAGLATAKIPFV